MYKVEGVAYATEELARAAAEQIHLDQQRSVRIERGDGITNSVSYTVVGDQGNTVAACEQLEPVDRTERLAKKFEPEPGSPPVPTLD